jgi:hypothetical protein
MMLDDDAMKENIGGRRHFPRVNLHFKKLARKNGNP